jgi:hypothetical protein
MRLAVEAKSSVVANAYAATQWIDIVRYRGGPVPAGLRIEVEIEGYLNLDVSSGKQARVGLSVHSHPTAELFTFGPNTISGTSTSVVFASLSTTLPGQPHSLVYSSSDAYNLTTPALSGDIVAGRISWDAYFNLDYNPTAGGYILNLYAGTAATGFRNGAVTGDFSNTIRLTRVTLADGTDVSDQVTFDSGFRLLEPQAVPAPPGIVLAGLGVVMLLGRAWVRRRLDPVVA